MIRVHIVPDPFDKNTWFSEDVENVCDFLISHYDGKFPQNTKIYEGGISEDRDITPKNQDDIEYLNSVTYDIFVVQYPALAFLAVLAIVNIVLTVIAAVFVFLSMPKAQGGVAQSPNNELSRRVNQARLNGRIPDIYGQVRSTPDLIAEPHLYYNDKGIEIEDCVMAIGRGYYLVQSCKDGETDVEAIEGVNVSIYDPNKSLTGSETIYKSGDAFDLPPLEVKSSGSINGQTLEKPNTTILDNDEGAGVYFESYGVIKNKSSFNFAANFVVGEGIAISGAQFTTPGYSISGAATITSSGDLIIDRSEIPDFRTFKKIKLTGASIDRIVQVPDPNFVGQLTNIIKTYDLSGEYVIASFTQDPTIPTKYTIRLGNPRNVNYNWNQVNQNYSINSGIELTGSKDEINLDETYTIREVTQSTITLENAETINPDWVRLRTLMGGTTADEDADEVMIEKVDNKWVGWFDLNLTGAEFMYFSVYFPQGLYNKDKKGRDKPNFVRNRIQYQSIDENGTPYGDINVYEFTIRERKMSAFGRTYKIPLPVSGGVRFRACCYGRGSGANPVSECKAKSVYLAKESSKLSYGDITVIRSKTIATSGALSVKERRLNCLVTRKLKVNGTGALVPTKQADQIIINMALDSKIGRRSQYEVDTAQIISEIQKARSYFGSELATEFCYTFSDKSLSFEESVGMVGAACFSEIYRYGSTLRARFEAPQQNSILLFNHSNKVLGSEKRTYEFGIENSHDGITLEYTSPIDDAKINYKIPENGTATNPLEIKTSGIRNEKQAKTRAWREWNKLKYKSLSIEFEALYEAEILARNDRILVADNTNTKTQDGEIEWVGGLEIGTSQPSDFSTSGNYYIHLQLPSGRTESILCSRGDDDYTILLSRAPSEALIVDEGKRARATYLLAVGNSENKTAFMIDTISPSTDNSNSVKCFNYDSRFYESDHEFF